jgi:hypothetical protein
VDPSGIGPELLQSVVIAHISLEDVDHDVGEVHEHPVRTGQTLDTQRELATPGQHLANMIRNRFDLTFRVAGTQDQVIGDGGELRDVENEDVFGLFLE